VIFGFGIDLAIAEAVEVARTGGFDLKEVLSPVFDCAVLHYC
jgi:hypothetical protein